MEPVADTKEFISSVYSISLDSIQMALSLTVALAWYAVIKGGINKIWVERADKFWAHFVYALVITGVFVLVLMFMRKILKAPTNVRPVTFALTQSSL
jgi:uncharacterized membrane protein